jgi:hypothetical protein
MNLKMSRNWGKDSLLASEEMQNEGLNKYGLGSIL